MTATNDGSISEVLVQYVRQALDCIDRGEQVNVRELCAEHPELAPRLAEVLGLAEQMAEVSREALRTDPLAGVVLGGRYVLESCLGRGAMGVVYRAEDRELRRPVAVKILDARLFRDPQGESRFRREGETLAALRHPAVVAVFDRGSTPEGIHFLVMELLQGCTLAAFANKVGEGVAPATVAQELLGAPLTEMNWWRQCARWGMELAEGLATAHAAGIVHRDVKPSNAFVRTDGHVALLDFGIAARDEVTERLTATATTLGSPWYMAPEQVRSSGAATPLCDVYGLGASLYHLLSGRTPYEGGPAEVLSAIVNSDPPPLRSLRRDLPRDLVAVVERSMERDPGRRHRDAKALAEDLRSFLEHRPVSARPIGWVGRRLRAARRSPTRAIALVASTVAVLLAAVVLPLWNARAADARTKLLNEKAATLPVLLAVEGQPNQRLVEVLLPDQQKAIDLLDEILEIQPDDLPVRLFRAAMRLDRGEREAAAADLDAIAASRKSRYLAALAERYRNADTARKGTEAVVVSNLPEPDGPEAAFVAGFHELRNRHLPGFAERAERYLGVSKDEYVPARDLRTIALLAMTDTARDADERKRLFVEIVDETLSLQGIYGQPTARTLAVRGAALVGLKRYDEAVGPLLQSLELRPNRHSPLTNLGIALRRLGEGREAAKVLEQAHLLRPDYWNTCYSLAQVYRDLEQFERAYEWAAKVPKKGPGGLSWKQPDLEANIALREEVVAHREHNREAVRNAAERAVAAFDRAIAGAEKDSQRAVLEVRKRLATSFAEGNQAAATVAFLELLQGPDPGDSHQIRSLAYMLPEEGLGPEATWLLRQWMRWLSRSLAGGDSELIDLLDREIRDTETRRPGR